METQQFEHDIDENIGWPVPIVPSEIYCKPPESYRKKLFYECMKIGDILECRIVSDSAFLEYYNLKVIHEHGIAQILDDLNIIVILPKKKTGGQIFKLYNLVRVVVTEIKRNTEDPEVWVTVDTDNLENLKRKPVLGLMKEDELPFYVTKKIQHETVVSASEPKVGTSKCCDPAAFPTYAEYLQNMTQFKNASLLQFMETAFGVDPIGVFSLTPNLNGLFVVINEIMNAELNKALTLINTAIKLYTEDDLLSSRLYVQRAKIYKELDTKMNKTYLVDLKKAIELNPGHEEAVKAFAHFLFKAANMKYQQQCYKVAVSWLQTALKLDEENSKALRLLQRIMKRHPEAIISLSEGGEEINHKATNSTSEMSGFHQNQLKRKYQSNGPNNLKKRKEEMKDYSAALIPCETVLL